MFGRLSSAIVRACRRKFSDKKATFILGSVLVSTLTASLILYVFEIKAQKWEEFVPSPPLGINSLPLTPQPSTPSLLNYSSSVSADCSTVHVAMVVSGDIGSRHLYTAIKSVLIHRSTPLHFHFITDSQRAKTVLHTMMSTWLVPAVSHDYYDLRKVWTKIRSSSHCSQSLSILLNLDLFLPDNLQHVIVIEPASVVTIDLAQLWALTKSRHNGSVTVCQRECVSPCNRGTDIRLTGWGAVGVSLQKIRKQKYTLRHNCTPCASDIADQIMMKLFDLQNSSRGQLCTSVLEYDGELLRYKNMEKCPKGMKPLVHKAPPKKDECKLFEWERKAHRRELPFLLGHNYRSSDEHDVTLATHLDYNRLNLLERTLENWDGPASVAIHLTDSQLQGVISFLLNSESLQHRLDVSYHLLFRVGPSYPPNHARELAHRFVSTAYMFILDVDFISSFGLYALLKERLKANVFGNMNKTAVVVPAFETDNTYFTIPHTKSEMVGLFRKGHMRQFKLYSYERGHGPTDYSRWINAIDAYSVAWKDKYEPYYLLKTSVVSFDHQFIARFCNKISHSTELHMAGYQFLVFPSAFVVHLPHRGNTQNMYTLRKCNQNWYKRWIMEKRHQYQYTKNDILNEC